MAGNILFCRSWQALQIEKLTLFANLRGNMKLPLSNPTSTAHSTPCVNLLALSYFKFPQSSLMLRTDSTFSSLSPETRWADKFSSTVLSHLCCCLSMEWVMLDAAEQTMLCSTHTVSRLASLRTAWSGIRLQIKY